MEQPTSGTFEIRKASVACAWEDMFPLLFVCRTLLLCRGGTLPTDKKEGFACFGADYRLLATRHPPLPSQGSKMADPTDAIDTGACVGYYLPSFNLDEYHIKEASGAAVFPRLSVAVAPSPSSTAVSTQRLRATNHVHVGGGGGGLEVCHSGNVWYTFS